MKLQIYSIYDKKGEVYHPPFYQHNDATAKRQFNEMCKDKNQPMAHYPEDYQLFRLGVFNDDSGKIEGVNNPTFVCNATSIYSNEEKDKQEEKDSIEVQRKM